MRTPLDPRVENSLDSDFYRRSFTSLVAFILFQGIILFVPLHTSGLGVPITILLIVSMIRIGAFLRVRAGKMNMSSYKLMTRNLLWIHSPLWGFILQQMIYQNHYGGMTTILANFLMAIFVAGSFSVLASDIQSLLIFTCGSILPATFTLFWMLYQNQVSEAIPLALIYPAMFVLAIRNGFWVHKELMDSLTNRFAVEDSQKRIIEETQKAQLATRLASLGVMASGLAHEINNPLMIASGVVQRAMRRPDGANPETLRHVQQSLERIAKIVRSLDQLGEQGKPKDIQQESLVSLVQSCLDICKERFAAKKIELKVDTIPNILLNCHPTHISQLILGILNNAFEAIPEGRAAPAALAAQDAWIQMSFRQGDDRIWIYITNSGPAIDAEIEDKIFDPFFTTKVHANGSGLGLSIARAIAREHGGELRLIKQAHPCFEVELPRVNAPSLKSAA